MLTLSQWLLVIRSNNLMGAVRDRTKSQSVGKDSKLLKINKKSINYWVNEDDKIALHHDSVVSRNVACVLDISQRGLERFPVAVSDQTLINEASQQRPKLLLCRGSR